jgi:hypothetical protein
VLKARYFRHLDTKDWDGLASLFTDDATMDVSEDSGRVIEGPADFVTGVAQALEGAETVHHGHMPEIEVTSPTEAHGVWAMEDRIRWPRGAEVGTLHGWGHYHETYRRVDGEWRIATLRLTRLRRDLT